MYVQNRWWWWIDAESNVWHWFYYSIASSFISFTFVSQQNISGKLILIIMSCCICHIFLSTYWNILFVHNYDILPHPLPRQMKKQEVKTSQHRDLLSTCLLCPWISTRPVLIQPMPMLTFTSTRIPQIQSTLLHSESLHAKRTKMSQLVQSANFWWWFLLAGTSI